jgi:hypothetical protein
LPDGGVSGEIRQRPMGRQLKLGGPGTKHESGIESSTRDAEEVNPKRDKFSGIIPEDVNNKLSAYFAEVMGLFSYPASPCASPAPDQPQTLTR